MENGAPGSRCFVVCGKAVTTEELQAAFAPYGTVESVKVIREKGVAYVKYDRASAAALAIETLNGAVLNNGRGPKLKVLLAEAPTARNAAPQPKLYTEVEVSTDPDNTPPRSRLFVVVPKSADARQIQEDIASFADLEYCKTDLVATKGVVFCKFSKSSSALKALETIQERGTVSGYKVKAMLAEPKTKRKPPGSPEMMYHMQAAKLNDYAAVDQLKLQLGSGLPGGQMGMADYNAIAGLSSLAGAAGLNSFNAAALASNMNNLADMHLAQGLNFVNSLGGLPPTASPVSPNNAVGLPLSKQRLFVVVHKGVSEDALARLFRRFPGMEYCDLKKDRATGKSKGYAYINYSTPDAAISAVQHLNGTEFPLHSGNRIKVMFAEPLGVRTSSAASATSSSAVTSSAGAPSVGPHHRHSALNGGQVMVGVPMPTPMGVGAHGSASMLSSRSPGGMSMQASSAASGAHTPHSRSATGLGAVTPDTLASVSDSLAGMSMHRVSSVVHSSGGVMEDGSGPGNVVTAAARLTSPVAPNVARELMFGVN